MTDQQKAKLMRMQQQQQESEAFRRANEDGVATTPLLSRTRSGRGYKPGADANRVQEDLDLANYDTRNINMGDLSERRQSDNPLKAFAEFAGFNPKK